MNEQPAFGTPEYYRNMIERSHVIAGLRAAGYSILRDDETHAPTERRTLERAAAYHDDLAARAALSGPRDGWRDMTGAPKDGTEFQAWTNAWEPRCRFNPDSEAFEIWGRVDYDMDGWDVYPHLTPTHWMPLPAAPASLSAGGTE